MTAQQVNVTVVKKGCGSGCGTVLAFILVLGLIGLFFKYWYITVPIAGLVTGLYVAGVRRAKQQLAQGPRHGAITVPSTQVEAPRPARPPVALPSSPPAPTLPPPVVAPGWKTDPVDSSHVAYWDGMQYTAHRRWNGTEWV